MRLKSILIHSAAAVTLALVLPAVSPVTLFHSTAQAATNVSVSIDTFYNDLAPHGSWVSYEDSYVFVPANISADWRPYTIGHWAYTKRYGWLWVSDEPFGWATYHYGRWGYAEDIGWYWVPGKRWAPAWVSWRRSSDHMVWAPLPPGRGGDVEVEINAGDIPDDYWVAVPSRNFLDADLSVVVIHDNSERVHVVEQAEPVGNVTIENNVVINNVIDVDYVEKQTQHKVKAVTVKETDNPEQIGKASGGEVTVFSKDVQQEANAKPADVKDVEAVKKEHGQGVPGTTGSTTPAPGTEGETTGTQGKGQTGESATPTEEQPIKKKKATGQSSTQPEEAQPEEGQGQPMKKKKATGQSSTQPEEAQPEEGQGQPMKKKKATGQSSTQPEEAQPEEGQGQPMKKKKATGQSSTQPEEAQPAEGQGQPMKKKKATGQSSSEPQEAQPEEGQPVKKKKASGQSSEAQPQEAQPEEGQEQPMKKKKNAGQPQEVQPEEGQGQPAKGCDPTSGEGCAQ